MNTIDPNEVEVYEKWNSGVIWGVCVTGFALVVICFGFLFIKNCLMAVGF